MNILVTGGSGYIGSHTCIELLAEGYEVIVVDNLVNSKYEVIERIEAISKKKIQFYEGNIGDKNLLQKIFESNSINAVLHFAGLKSVNESIEDPIRYYKANISETVNLLEVMQANNVKKIVFSSSATVYGKPRSVPINECAETNPLNPYGRSKLMIEQILNDIYISDSSWNISILRYFNPIGAHESGHIGEEPKGIPNNLLPYISKVAMGELEYLNIYGNDYDTEDGTGVRDYIHVVDLAEGHIKALKRIIEHSDGINVINLGTGNGYSVLEVVKAFEEVSGVTINFRYEARRQGDVARSFADIKKAKQLLEWESKRDLKQMCKDSWNFVEKLQSEEL